MYQTMYLRRKEKLLKDKSINPKNKEVIKKFFEWEEYRLKRKEGLSEVDERSYKTLSCGMINRASSDPYVCLR